MESNEALRNSSAAGSSQRSAHDRQFSSRPGRWLKIAYLLWIIFAIVVCGRIIVQAISHPQQHLDHTVYPILAEGSIRWWADLPLHGLIEELQDIYRYSPTFAVLFTPFACLPEWLGACLWGLLSIGVFVAAMRVLSRELLPGKWTVDRQGVFLGLTLLGAMSGIHSGQSNALLVALVIFAMQAIKYQRWWMASFLLAIPVFIKLWPLAVVLLLAACFPKQLFWRFVLVAIAFALLPFLTRPPSVVIGQYQEWYASLTGPQQHRWPGIRDAWTIREQLGNAFHGTPVAPGKIESIPKAIPGRGYQVLQLTSALAVLGWCLWQKRRLLSGAMPTLVVGMREGPENSQHAHGKRGHGTEQGTGYFIYPVGELLTAILSIWVSWQLLFGPGSEQITYGIIAPSAAWAVMASFRQRNDDLNSVRARCRRLFHRGWTIFTWLILGLFGMGDIENPFIKLHPAATMLLPLGVVMFVIWLVIYDLKDRKSHVIA
jgi:alpha-1,2-mannosyltransferase